ncbi:Asparagine synthetase [Sulfurovum sp. enrichment culture clone C5]|uniref:asparagine synthase (glutamine-hydrolyzing) n=1 Tax=Sulfurovum sp. enrichment culture clone C5 TaxID=497650 RepID=A0A0S4XQ26_9BACT|nr:Asparagine synthetase [Sulfurovum sp. enrichment culture clone C5]
MSAFFLLMQRDDTSPSATIIDKLYRKTISWQHDEEKILIHKNIVLAQATQWISELDKKTKLPLSIEINNNSYLFTGDVRPDNRNELIKQLNITEKEPSNAELIIRSYLKWGEDYFADHLLGDFSFALFDISSEKLLCVRDHIGVRPLYYHSNDSFFLVSDAIEVILAHPDVSQELNDNVVAEFALKGWVFNQQETFFTSIQKCPKATCLKVTKNDIASHEYWDIQGIKPLQYDTEEEYMEHLQNLLNMVIQDRIDSTYPISAHMSGGLDSSVIATIAGRMWRDKGNKEFYTYNWCKPQPDDDPEWHEWGDARKIAQIEGFKHTEIDCNANEIKKTLLSHDIRVDGTTMYEYERVLLPQAQAKGIRLILSGFGGDEFLTTRIKDTHIDKIRKGKFISAWKALRNELPKSKKLNFIRLPYRYVRLLLTSMLTSNFRHRKLLKIIKKRLLSSASLLDDIFATFAISKHSDSLINNAESILETQHGFIDYGYHQERMESWSALGRKFGIRYRYPYLDKRVVEFALSLPSSLYFKNEQSRYLYKLSTKDYLSSFMLNKGKPTESNRVINVLKEIYEAMIYDDIVKMIRGYNSRYINHEKYLKQYDETMSKQERIEDIKDMEELMKIDRLKNILLIKVL